jgi:hypothetical protein
MIHKFDGPQSGEALEQWWRYHSDSFFAVRNEQGEVQGFYHVSTKQLWHRKFTKM